MKNKKRFRLRPKGIVPFFIGMFMVVSGASAVAIFSPWGMLRLIVERGGFGFSWGLSTLALCLYMAGAVLLIGSIEIRPYRHPSFLKPLLSPSPKR